jgi:hypothetical protein
MDLSLVQEVAHSSGSESDSADEIPLADAGLLPGADLELARLHAEHTISMMELRHEREVHALRQDARSQERSLRRELRQRDKMLATLAQERSELTAALGESQRSLSRLGEQYAALNRKDMRHQQQLATSSAQMAAERASFDARLTSQRERLDEASARAAAGEQAASDARRELEKCRAECHEMSLRLSEAQSALESGRKELSNVSTAKAVLEERVREHEHALARLEDAGQLSEQMSRAREEELRATCTALATAREQRNQAAREADACRVGEVEAREALGCSSEELGALEARVQVAEQRVADEVRQRQEAEDRLTLTESERHVEFVRRQHRMIRVLRALVRAQRALGFARWASSVSALHARESADARLGLLAEMESMRASMDVRDRLLYNARSVGRVCLSSLDTGMRTYAAADAFYSWARAATEIERSKAQNAALWMGLVRRAQLCPEVAATARARPSWRLILKQRVERVRAHSSHPEWRCCRQARDTAHLSRSVLDAWRLWAESQRLHEECAAAEARHACIHVTPVPWWEA